MQYASCILINSECYQFDVENKDFVKHLRIKNNAIETWRLGDDVTIIKCKWERLWKDIYRKRIEGVRHNIKFQGQKNEIIKWNVLLECSGVPRPIYKVLLI